MFLAKAMRAANSISQVASWKQIHDQIEVISIIESTDHVGDERGCETFENFALIEDVVD